jgi:hypothetical protein
MLKFLVNSLLGSGSRIQDPVLFSSGIRDGTIRSGINIPDPQICVTASYCDHGKKGTVAWDSFCRRCNLQYLWRQIKVHIDFFSRKFTSLSCLCLIYFTRPIPVRRLRHPESDCIFSTGTDEHGLKIQQAAALAGQLIIPVIKGAQVRDFRWLGLFFWFLHHKVSSVGRLWG